MTGSSAAFIALLISAALVSFPIHASATITGYELYRQCTSQGDNPNANADRLGCAAYLAGYLDGAYQVSRLNALSPAPIKACPGDIPVGQYLMVFEAWARRNPQWLSRSAPDNLAAALVEAFPCQAK